MSPEKASLNKVKLKTLINFNFKSNTFYLFISYISSFVQRTERSKM